MRAICFVVLALVAVCSAQTQQQGQLAPAAGPRYVTPVTTGSCSDAVRAATGCCANADDHNTQCCVKKDTCPSTLKVVVVTQQPAAPSCNTVVAQSSCCRSATDACCSKTVAPCYIQPEILENDATCHKQVRAASCCRSATDTCCSKAVAPCYVTPEIKEPTCNARFRQLGCCRTVTDSCCNRAVAPCYVTPEIREPAAQCTVAPQIVEKSCCKSATDSCCNRALQPCFVEPEYKEADCKARTVSVCCAAGQTTCCNNSCLASNARFAEVQAEAEAEAQAQVTVATETEAEFKGVCTEEVKVTRCCGTPNAVCCANPCSAAVMGNSTIGAMKMGQLKIPAQTTCSDEVAAKTCCEHAAAGNTCCKSCASKSYVSADMVTHTDADCPSNVRESTCCSASVSKCCNQCLGSNMRFAEVQAEAETEIAAEPLKIAPFTDAQGKNWLPATVEGCSIEKRNLRCCNTDTEHINTCCRARSECTSGSTTTVTVVQVPLSSLSSSAVSSACTQPSCAQQPTVKLVPLAQLQNRCVAGQTCNSPTSSSGQVSFPKNIVTVDGSAKPMTNVPTILSSTCSDAVKASTCCSAAVSSCCSVSACQNQAPVTKIGDMQMGTKPADHVCNLTEAQQVQTCCTSATDKCCNAAKPGCPSF